MSRYTGRHAAARPGTLRRLGDPRIAAPIAAAGLVLAATSGSLGADAASATAGAPGTQAGVSSAAAQALADRSGTREAAVAAAASIDTAGELAADATREQSTVRAQRTAERQALVVKKAKEAAKKKAEAKKKAAAAARIKAAHAWVSPIKNPHLTSGFGARWGRLHAGLDFGAVVGTPLRSLSTGTVTEAGWGGGYGQKVEITYWDGTVSYFAHMSVISVTKGQKVTPGMIVGKSGNTGHSTGPHLHLEIHPGGGDPVDPRGWLAKHGLKL
ncbi:M23 family metallopeptidase [Nostocoides australiense]